MDNDSRSAFHEWQKEKQFLESEKAARPELFERPVLIDDGVLLKRIGVEEEIFGKRPLGHIKLFPEDFIVEEVSKDGTLHMVDDATVPRTAAVLSGEARTVWADVIKMGLDTVEVVNELSKILGLEKKFIGIAGIKDKHALTAQAISFRGVDARVLSSIQSPSFFLKNISTGKGALNVGDLSGNRFTIFVRTKQPLNQTTIEEKLRDLEEQGFWNFFYIQRFGVPRLISHKLGLLILQGKFEETVKASLVHPSDRELPYFREFRKKLEKAWGKWDELLKIIEPVSYTLRSEKKMLRYLADRPKDFIGALNQIPEQIKLWAYAYGSYLFNKTLSKCILSGNDVPFELPLALSNDPRAKEFYGDFFSAHGIAPPFSALKNFPYVQKPEKDIGTLKKFTLHGARTVEEGIVIDFFLEKASYATTFLSHLFILSSGQPIPEGISTDEVDSKLLLGTGTIMPLREERFKELFEMRKDNPPIIAKKIEV